MVVQLLASDMGGQIHLYLKVFKYFFQVFVFTGCEDLYLNTFLNYLTF